MSRYTGPKLRIMRREGTDIGLKSRQKLSVTKRLTVSPGVHGHKSLRKKTSPYGLQLREKQKVKRMYGMMERQFRRFFDLALRKKGNTGENFLQLLESRLDNVVYRAGFALTRAAARQLVSHGHVYVNEKRVNIPSYLVKVGDKIEIKEKIYEAAPVQKAIETIKEHELPVWIERKGRIAKYLSLPSREQIATGIDEASIIEFYSR